MFGKLANMKLLLSSRKLLERQVFFIHFLRLGLTFALALCAWANVNLKEKRLAIYGKGYNDSLKLGKMKKKNTKKTTTFAHLKKREQRKKDDIALPIWLQ